MSSLQALPADVAAALRRMGLLPEGARFNATLLPGGVSSDIWKIETATTTFCAKRAVERLRVVDEWRAPVSRNATEVAWFRAVAAFAPGAVPRVLGHDASAGVFAMEFLDPASHVLWKTRLLDGDARLADATAVGSLLATIHARTAGDAVLAREFATDAAFHALRLEPYLLATARRHPDLAARFDSLVASLLANRRALVHGDASPKNILIGPAGPVLLDAETAWYGDPAFDVAFCLNHLLLKCLWHPPARAGYLACARALWAARAAGERAEEAGELEARVAHLVPALLLARVDGKSPVEYLDGEARSRLRSAARALLSDPPSAVGSLCERWEAATAGAPGRYEPV